MLRQVAAAALSLCLLAIGATAQAPPGPETVNANYAIVCSQVLRPGVDFRIGVVLFQRSTDHGIQTVTARLNTSTRGEKFSDLKAEAVWRREGDDVQASVDLTLLVRGDGYNYDTAGGYKLEVTIEDTLGSRYVNSTQIRLSQAPVTTLIQTDKAIYKPGQLVKFRIVNLNELLSPVLTDMEVLIKDSRRNLVDKQTHNLSTRQTWSEKAVMIGEFRLSDMPNEGDWTITAKTDRFTESKSFSVRQYVLPKFTLEVTLPDFVHFNDSEFVVRAKVLYTFDKAVEGTFNVTIGPYMNCMSCKMSYDQLVNFKEEAQPNGESSFVFNMTSWRQSLRARNYTSRHSVFTAKVSVQFKEKFTGKTKLEETTFSIYRRRYQLSLNTSQVPFFLPGFVVPVQIHLLQPNNQPFTGEAKSKATVTMTYHQRGKQRVDEVFRGSLEASPAGTGISLRVKIPTTADFHTVRIEAKTEGSDGSELTDSSEIGPFIGVTDDYVKIKMEKSPEAVEMEMEKTTGIRFAYYGVLSRGQVQRWGKYSDASSKVTFTKDELAGYVSDVTLVAFGLARNGEIVASVVKHELGRLGSKVRIESNLTLDKGQPQQWARISVMAEPESFVFVTGIDASVNLLATGQDIMQDTLASKYKSSVLVTRYWPRSKRLTTGKIIKENDLVVLSDAFYYTEDRYMGMMYGTRSRSMLGANADFESAPALPDALARKSGGGREGGTTQVRKFFPETMVWTTVQTDSEGLARHTFRLPDTITSWHLTAFGLAADKQIRTMDEAFKVTTFKNFFIRPVLPYSLVRGEKFLLKVLVFNYRDSPGKVVVALNVTGAATDVKIGPGQTEAASSAGRQQAVEVTVQPNAAGMALFELGPRGMPAIDLTISGTYTASDYTETDVVIKSLIVIPEGKTVHVSRSVLLNPPASGSSDRPEQAISIEYPDSPDLVPDSEVFSYSLIGDVMGPAMQNIDGLLRLPSGCGEQNMVNFAPAVFIWDYLSGTQQQNEEVREKATRVMKVGLQRQLTYKRRDGSYSAFGERDAAGSTWLTAFVLSIYAKASAYITIEPEALTGMSVKFLLDQQSRNGEFKEPSGGRVFDQGLQGSSAKASHGMTAFICLALLDVDEVARTRPGMQATTWKDLDVKDSVTKCLWYVSSAFASKPEAFSSYDTALSAYLLRRAQQSTTYSQASLKRGLDAMQTALGASAKEAQNVGGKYWSTDSYWGRQVASVEATAWALLGYSLADSTEDSLQIVRWLSNQQNSLGGFQSSQATVVGIRALAAFAGKVGLVSGDAGVEVVINGTTQAHSVKESKRLVLIQGPLMRGAKARAGSVTVRHAAGSGFALATLSWQYNLLDKRPLSAEWKMANGLGLRLGEVVPLPPMAGQFRMAVCAMANSSEGMHILRVTNPSGYIASQLPSASTIFGLKRVEPGPQEVVLYFDFIAPRGVCVTIGWTQEVPVLELSPQLISLQKYYSTEQIVSAPYLAPELKAMTQCKACPECPGCEPKESWLSWLI